MTRARVLLTAAVLALVAGCETTADLDPPVSASLSLRGRIDRETAAQFERLLPSDPIAGRAVIHLASGGGHFDSALKIARRLEAVPHSAAVVTRECDSACVLIFLAAHERLVERGAVFAVHRPQCTREGLAVLACRLFWEPWAKAEFHARIARVSPAWADYLDRQEPPAFAREGADAVRVTGAQLIGFGAAAPITRTAMRTALGGD